MGEGARTCSNLIDDAARLEDGLGADEDHLAARHRVRHGRVLDHRHGHTRIGELSRCLVAVTLWVRLRDDDRKVLRLGGGEQEGNHGARVAQREHLPASLDKVSACARDLCPRLERRAG